MSCVDGIRPAEDQRFAGAFREAIATGGETSVEFDYQGQRYLFLVVPERGPDGRVTHLVGRTESISGVHSGDQERAILAAIVRSSDDAVSSHTLDDVVTIWNDAAHRLYGYSAAEMVGAPMSNLVPDEHLGKYNEVLDRIRQGERIEKYVTERIRKDGRRITISVSTSPIFDGDDRLIGAATIAREISEWQAVEQTLKRRDYRFQTLIENSSDMIALIDADGIISYASPSTENVLGYRRDEFVGHRSSEFGDPVQRSVSVDERLAFLTTPGAVIVTEGRVRHKDGSWRWIEGSFSNLLHDPAVSAIVANYRDISERKRIAEERDSERRQLDQILDVLPEAVIVIDTAGRVLLTNRAVTKLLGPVGTADIRRRDGDEARIMSARMDGTPIALGDTPLHRSLRNGETVLGEQLMIVTADEGKSIPCLVSSAPLLDSAGGTIGAVAAFQDITDIKRFERSREEFLSSVSHDLKTPLTALLMVTQMTRRRLNRMAIPDLDPLLEQQDLAEKAIGRMTGMVDELLDMTRLQLGQPVPIDVHPVEMVALVRGCVDEAARTTNRHAISFDPVPAVIVRELDKRRFQRVVGNLLSNAIKFSPVDGPIAVRLEETQNEEVLLTVSDTGLGIPERSLASIFERYYRAPNVEGIIQGTGLGLATVREVVERHNGTISVESSVGRGSTFTVRLPRQERK